MALGNVQDAVQTNDAATPQPGGVSPSYTDGEWTPETVLSTLPHRPEPGSDSPIAFFHLLERLKTTKREGWRRFGINSGESISDHMYRMSIITMLCPPQLASKLDLARCTKMALVHDMAEALVGDITPVDGVAKEEKSRREATTMDFMTGSLLGSINGGAAGQGMREVWQEYEDSSTLESKFVHDVDKVELLLQMLEYERAHEGKLDLGEFSRVSRKIVLPEVQDWAAQLLEERKAYWSAFGKEPSGVKDISTERVRQQDEYYGTGANGQT